MMIEKTYNFTKEDYNSDGFNKTNSQLFLNFVFESEVDFHQQSIIFFADYLFANSSTMYLMKCCFANLEENDDFGMDLIDGEIDIDANMAMEDYSKRKITYALSSRVKGNEDEPLILVIDEKIRDGRIILKYIPDDDEENEDLNVYVPVDSRVEIARK